MRDPSGETTATLFGVSPVALAAARDALSSGDELEVGTSGNDDYPLAPLLPGDIRIAAFRRDLEGVIRSSADAGASDETVDALLAVSLTIAARFPDAC